ncbi:MAG: endonuclease/exonuclease/phosphatase family protein [Solirubrobacterales bacterium]
MALIALAIPAVADAKKKGKKGGPKVTVMTRNVYLGADLNPALGASGIPEAIDGAGQIWREFQSTNFPERAVPLAREIKDTKPDLVGLQEVASWYTQTPSDGGWTESGGLGAPASEAGQLEQNFLELLMAQLNEGKGPKYREVIVQEEFTGELPVDADDNTGTGTGPLAALGADFDAQLIMHDAILVKKGSKVKLGKTNAAHYDNRFTAEIIPGAVEVGVDRGWVSVEAKVGGSGKKGKNASASKKGGGKSKFRFINTHLEAFGEPTIREAQAKELIAGPANTNKQVILVGDINSGLQERHAAGSYEFQPGDPLAFEAFAAAGFKDNGAKKLNKPYPQTCCGDPRNADLVFDHTVDHVLTKPGLKTLKAFATGNDPDQRTPSGLWPSDHGGKVSKLQLKK